MLKALEQRLRRWFMSMEQKRCEAICLYNQRIRDHMIFHVINIDDPFLNSYFYALKLISQGRPSRRPHITIRGPFEADHSNLEALNNQLA